MDFVLWKPSKPGDPAWPSPNGIAMPGRPGWHIECSAMAEKHLGEVFDIHGGGIDLVFPHHENEVAQSRCAHGTPAMANYWMHNGFLTAPEGEKMSKSLGNFTTIHALRQQWPGEALRLALLSAQYRQPLPWTERVIADARRTLDHWYELTADAADGAPLCADVLEALEDDLNTPQAIAALHALRAEAAKGAKPAAACLKASARLMGLLQSTPAEWKAWRPATLAVDDKAIEAMIAARNAARKGQELQGGRSPSRRTHRPGHPAQGRQGPRHRRDRHDLGRARLRRGGGQAMTCDVFARRRTARAAGRLAPRAALGSIASVLGESADGIAVGAGAARKGDADGAVNRAYYATFGAARAALATFARAWPHPSGTARSTAASKAPRAGARIRSFLRQAFLSAKTCPATADYETGQVDEPTAREIIGGMQTFLATVEPLLKKAKP